MDVLLQRLGRLHRRQEADARALRPAGYEQPTVWIVQPEDIGSLLRWAVSPGPANWGFDRAYSNTASLVATARLVTGSRTFVLPRENRFLVEACVGAEGITEAMREYEGPGERARQAAEARALLEGGLGRKARFSFALSPFARQTLQPFEGKPGDELKRLSTRLGQSDRLVVLRSPAVSPFGRTIKRISVPAHVAEAVGLGEDTVDVTAEALSVPALLFRRPGEDRPFLAYDISGLVMPDEEFLRP